MDVNKWIHDDVLPDGSIVDPDGEVVAYLSVIPKIVRSPDDGGCGEEGCSCEKVWFISISYGYDASTKTVSGVTINFNSQDEFMDFIIMGVSAVFTSPFSFNTN